MTDSLDDSKANDEIAQLNHGKHLLEKAQIEGDEANAVEAVKWLRKSSRSANEEATVLLRTCLDTNFGITDKNVDDVKWCIRTSSWEKRSRAAASKLFRKICLEDKNLTKEQYKERVADISRNKLEKKLLEKAAKNGLSEEAFVDRVMHQLQGRSGWSLRSLMRTDADGETYNEASFFKKIFLYPGKTLTWIMDNIIETAGTQGMLWLKTLIPVQQVYMLVVLFIYSLVSVDAILWVLPVIGFYISFASVVICTMQMFYTKRKLDDVRVLADMLDRFNETFIQESAESAYSWSSITPYISFFASLPLMILTFVVADKTCIPCSEIACITLVITVACWFALSDYYDHLATLAILLDNISTLPHIVARMPRIPVVYNILDFLANFGISFEIFPEFYFKLGLPSLAYLTVPMIFVRMAMKKSLRGSYQIMIPHLVCFFWWRIVVMFYLETTWYGLLRASCGWASLVILSPFLLIVGTFWLVLNLFKLLSLTGMMKIATTLCLLGTVALFAYWSRGGFRFGSFSLENKSSKTNVILTVVLLASFVPLVYIAVPDDTGKPIQYLPWEIYKKHCGEEKWKTSTIAQAMTECHHFTHTKVNWTGTIKQITIKQVENQAENIIGLLPSVISDWLRCTYGEEYSTDCTSLSTEFEQDVCKYNKLQGKNCHLQNLGRFTFEVLTDIDGQNSVRLIAPHVFKDILLRLNKHDIIMFRGLLSENLGNTIPTIKIYNLKCLTCMENAVTFAQQGSWQFFITLKLGIYGIFNFFFSPLFVLQ